MKDRTVSLHGRLYEVDAVLAVKRMLDQMAECRAGRGTPEYGTGAARPSPSATRSRLASRHCERCVPGVADHYSQPRSRKAERSTPGGANQPPAPYLAPSFNATSLLP